MNTNHRRVLLLSSSTILLLGALLAAWPSPTPRPLALAGHSGTTTGTTSDANAPPSSERSRVQTAGYTAPVGTRLVFDLSLDNAVTVRGTAAAAGQPQPDAPFAVQLAGPMQLVVLDRSADDVIVGCTLAGARIETGSDVPAARAWRDELQQCLQRGFDVRMDVAGTPRGWRCRGAWNATQRQFARALIGALRAELQPDAEWTSSVEDAMGTHTFAWQRTTEADDVVVRRERTAFVPRLDAEAGRSATLAGGASARFAAAVGWLTGLEIDEAVGWSWLGDKMHVDVRLRGSLRWLRSDVVDVDATGSGAFEGLDGPGEAPAAGVDPVRRMWQERLAGRDVPALLTELAALLAQSPAADREHMELLQLLAECVRGEPAQADVLAAAVQAARLTGQLAADVLAVLGMAGHERAQAGLAAVYGNGLVDAGLRGAAVDAMFQLEQPATVLVDTLQRELQSAPRLDGLAGSTMLVLGAFAGRGARTSDGRPLIDTLLALEATARGDGVEHGFFEALGNSGDPAVVPIAARLLRDTSPVERAFGLTALRRVDSATARELLRATARGDADADVRRHAVEQAADAAWATDLLIERANGDAAVDVRRAACAVLAQRARTDARAAAALRARLAAETDAGLLGLLRNWNRDP